MKEKKTNIAYATANIIVDLMNCVFAASSIKKKQISIGRVVVKTATAAA